jgi:hypothetical protein
MPRVSIRRTGETRKQVESILCRAFKAEDIPLVRVSSPARDEPVRTLWQPIPSRSRLVRRKSKRIQFVDTRCLRFGVGSPALDISGLTTAAPPPFRSSRAPRIC